MSETPTPRPATTRPIQYKGEDLESERGPGLGCFRFQLIVLAILIVLTPVSVALGWPYEVSAALLFVTLILLLLAGQTIIFLLRLVAAERRGRRAPLAPRTPTVGQIEDAGRIEDERQIEDARQIDEARTLEAAGDSGAVDVAEVEQATDAPGHRAAGQSAGDPRGDTTQPR